MMMEASCVTMSARMVMGGAAEAAAAVASEPEGMPLAECAAAAAASPALLLLSITSWPPRLALDDSETAPASSGESASRPVFCFFPPFPLSFPPAPLTGLLDRARFKPLLLFGVSAMARTGTSEMHGG
jgi:hypothetical protein